VKYTIADFLRDYPSDDVCLDEIFQNSYGDVPYCSGCGVVDPKYHRVHKRKSYACQDCGYQIYPLAGTIFHKSRTPLRLWFYAIYQFSVSKNGISAKELERQLGVTYKCAWRMARQIRLLMKQEAMLLQGVVEADEAYIGGRRRSSNRWSNKAPLLGAVERGGKVRVAVTNTATTVNVNAFLAASVVVGSTLQTDESHLYHQAEKTYTRKAVNHGAHNYVDGDNYTNTIEGFWGLLKPALVGTHRSVSKKYLQLYVNERVWHYNHRQQPVYALLVAEASKQLR
jgi:transposase-like protein